MAVRKLALLLLMSAAPVLAAAPQKASDPDVLKGIAAVEEGEYDLAIVTLDAAIQRLSAAKAKSDDLAQAYVYLGVAYLGKGHEATAKARFRDAVLQMRELQLTTDKFAPRVIELFEQAKAESPLPPKASTPAATAPAAAPTAAPAPPPKKSGSKTPIILIGVGVVAAGAGVAVAAGGGSSSSTPTPAPSPTPQPESQYILSGPDRRDAPIEINGILRVVLEGQTIGEFVGGPNPVPPVSLRARPGNHLMIQARTLGEAYFMSRLVLWKIAPSGEAAPQLEAPGIPGCSLPTLPCPLQPNPNGIVFFEVTWTLP